MPFYPKGFAAAFKGDIDIDVDTIRASLMNTTHSFNNAHDFWNDVSANVIATVTLTGVTSTFSGDIATLDANDPTWTSVGSGSTARYVVFWKDTGTPSTSPLISSNQLASDIPTNGGNITGTIDVLGFGYVDVTP